VAKSMIRIAVAVYRTLARFSLPICRLCTTQALLTIATRRSESLRRCPPI
jgi:hypothetical protein